MAHQVLSDMMVTAWLTWALYLFLVAMEHGDRGRWAGFYLCLAGGIASKGPAALMVLAAALATAVADDGWRGVKRLRLPTGLAILALTALPWLLPYLLQGERSYVRSVVVGHYVDWYFRSKGSRLLHFLSNFVRFMPWTIFLVPAVVWWRRHPDLARRRVLALAVSLSGEQRARYFLPVFPLLSLLVAEFLVRGATAWPRGRRVTIALLGAGVVASLGAAVGLLGGAFSRDVDGGVFVPAPGWEREVAAAAIIVGTAAALVALWRWRAGAAAGACLAGALGLVLAVEAYGYPARYARWYALRDFAGRAAVVLPPDTPIVAYPDANLTYDFYLRRPIREIFRPAEIAALISARPAAVLLVREEHWRALAGGADPRWRMLASGVVAGHTMLLVGEDRR